MLFTLQIVQDFTKDHHTVYDECSCKLTMWNEIALIPNKKNPKKDSKTNKLTLNYSWKSHDYFTDGGLMCEIN